MFFVQEDFSYQDLFSENTYLQDLLKHYVDKKYVADMERDLANFSKRVSTDILQMSKKAEREEPEWVPYDHWGNKIDDIINLLLFKTFCMLKFFSIIM